MVLPPLWCQHRYRAARLLQLLFGALAELVRTDGELLGNLAIPQDFEAVMQIADDALRHQRLRRDLGVGIEALFQRAQVDQRVDRLMDGMEAMRVSLAHAALFRQAAVQRGLPAFEVRVDLAASLIALVAASTGLAMPGADAADRK